MLDSDSIVPKAFASDSEKDNGFSARISCISGALEVADLVRSTLGPKGMDKILHFLDHEKTITVTNDGATILKSICVENAAAKILIDVSKVQDSEVGDGTTSVVLLTSALLKEAQLILEQKTHPTIVISGFREACELARKKLISIASNQSECPFTEEKTLISVAKTTLSSKIVAQDKEHFSRLAVDAILRLRGSRDLDMIHIIKKSGATLRDSFIDEGFILDKKLGLGQPRLVKHARVLIANTPMDADKIKIYGTKVKSNTSTGVGEIEAVEKAKMKAKCDKVLSYQINCFINRQLIYDYPEKIFTQNGVITIEHADFDGIERLAKVLGSDIVSSFDSTEGVRIGHCELIEEIVVGEERAIRFSGVDKGEACTIVIRGSSSHIVEEAERSLHDALCVLASMMKDSRVLFGGGSSEMQMAQAIDDQAARTPGKKSMVLESFARAVRQIPAIICENAGLDSADIISALRVAHNSAAPTCSIGIDVLSGKITDMKRIGVIETLRVKLLMLLSATEAAECILRVDGVIKNKPRQRRH